MPFNPLNFGIETVYSSIIVVLCFFVYFKTKELYSLSKYRGIKYFRTSFLLFGLSYLTRFVSHIFMIGTVDLAAHDHKLIIFPVMLVVTAYLSTLAIFYLAYSTIWKKLKLEHFLLFSNLVAAAVSIFSFISRTPFTTMIVQIPLLIFTLVIILFKHKKKRSNTSMLYFLIVLLWLVNLYTAAPRWLLSIETKILLQVISVVVFLALAFKVKRWTK